MPSKCARLPQFLKLTTSETNKFCETSSIFELDNIKNKQLLQDILNLWPWKHQFSETSFNNRQLSAELPAAYQCTLCFFNSICLKYCTCHEKVVPRHTNSCTCPHNRQSKSEDLTLLNTTFLRQSAPWLPDISGEHGEHVSCIALFQILLQCLTPRMVFGHSTHPSPACALLTGRTIPGTCRTERHFDVQTWS